MQRNKGALGALIVAGLAYAFKNRKQLTDKLKGLSGGSAQRQLPSSTTSTSDQKAYTGDTVRM